MERAYDFFKPLIVGASLLVLASLGDVYAQGGCGRNVPRAVPESRELKKEERGWCIPRVPLGPRQNFEPKRKVDESCCPRYFVRQYEPK